MDNSPSRVGRRLLVWTAVCSIAAAPSFIWAAREYDWAGMVCGVICFIIAYTIASGTATAQDWRVRPFVRTTLYIGYITRLTISVIYPLGLGADLLPGTLSIAFVEALLGIDHGFAPTLLITLVQGTLLNLILAVYMLLIYGIQKLFRKPPIPAGCCRKCGYDLRASPIRCPECGEPVPEPSTTPSPIKA